MLPLSTYVTALLSYQYCMGLPVTLNFLQQLVLSIFQNCCQSNRRKTIIDSLCFLLMRPCVFSNLHCPLMDSARLCFIQDFRIYTVKWCCSVICLSCISFSGLGVKVMLSLIKWVWERPSSLPSGQAVNNQDNFFTEFLTEITHEATWLWTFLVGQFLITDSTSFNAYRKSQAFQLYLYRWPWTTRGGGGVRGLSPLRVRNPRTTLQLALCVPGSASMNSTKRRSRSETATENKSACKGTHALQSCGVQGPTLFFPEVRSPCLTSKMNYREKWFLISSCHDSARAGAGAPPAWLWPQASPSFAITWSVLSVSFPGTNI